MSAVITVVLGAMFDIIFPQPRYYVIDFAPMDNLKREEFQKIFTFVGSTSQNQRINLNVRFKATLTATEVRELVVKQFNLATLQFKKVDETKLVVLGCKNFDIKTRDLRDKELPENCRPTMRIFASEKEATGDKDK